MLEKIPSIIGEALRGVRPGLEKTVSQAHFAEVPETIAVESAAFGHEQPIPAQFTEDGEKTSPPVTWANLPSGTTEVLLIVEDADSPTPAPLVHAIAFHLPKDGGLAENGLKGAPGLSLGENSFGKAEWLPPDPPSGHGPHRYVFQVYALGQPVELGDAPGRSAVIEAMSGKVSAKGVLIGTYERP